jgi:hypothetical protein
VCVYVWSGGGDCMYVCACVCVCVLYTCVCARVCVCECVYYIHMCVWLCVYIESNMQELWQLSQAFYAFSDRKGEWYLSSRVYIS